MKDHKDNTFGRYKYVEGKYYKDHPKTFWKIDPPERTLEIDSDQFAVIKEKGKDAPIMKTLVTTYTVWLPERKLPAHDLPWEYLNVTAEYNATEPAMLADDMTITVGMYLNVDKQFFLRFALSSAFEFKILHEHQEKLVTLFE